MPVIVPLTSARNYTPTSRADVSESITAGVADALQIEQGHVACASVIRAEATHATSITANQRCCSEPVHRRSARTSATAVRKETDEAMLLEPTLRIGTSFGRARCAVRWIKDFEEERISADRPCSTRTKLSSRKQTNERFYTYRWTLLYLSLGSHCEWEFMERVAVRSERRRAEAGYRPAVNVGVDDRLSMSKGRAPARCWRPASLYYGA